MNMIIIMLLTRIPYLYLSFCGHYSFALISSTIRSTHYLNNALEMSKFDSVPIDIKIRSETDLIYPELVVFDMDMCLWSPEMYTLNHIPLKSDVIIGKLGNYDEGVIGVKSDYDQIRLFPDALTILQDIYQGVYGNNLKIAVASSADTPHAVSIGKAAMSFLEVLPGVTLRQVFAKGWSDGFDGNIQVGRTPPLSSNKAETHFPILHRETQIAYNKMIFLDDCNCKPTTFTITTTSYTYISSCYV